MKIDTETDDLPAVPSTFIVRQVRYLVDVQSVSGRWDNVEIRRNEEEAREKEKEWRGWVNENRKSWRDIRVVKETILLEVLPSIGICATKEDGE
jgi:hypothetical protein